VEKISVQKLNDKRVVDSEGGEVGIYHNIVAEVDTGMLKDLVVRPAAELDTSKFRKDGTYIFMPFDAVKAVKDVVVVDSEKMRVRA
jgi:sporulation protein YlmC with PRC-barrel domain